MYRIRREDGKTTLYAEGKIDTNKAPEFAEAMKEALAGTTELVIDCSELTYFSSSALRVVMIAIKTMARQGEMSLINVSEPLYDILETTGFTGVCEISMKEEPK